MAELLRAFLDQPAPFAGATAPGGRRCQGEPQAEDRQGEIKKGSFAMNAAASRDAYGSLIEPTTLKIQRRLPGPIERVWAYITDGELRRKWLAAGQMETRVGATVEMVWRNDELTNPPGHRPAGFSVEHRMPCKILEIDPPRHIVFTFGTNG